MSNAKNTVETVREVLAAKLHRFVRIVEGLVSQNDTRPVNERAELIDLHIYELMTQIEFAQECDCITSGEYHCIRSEADRVWSWAGNIIRSGTDESTFGQARLGKYEQACQDIKWRASLLRNEHAPQALNPNRRKPLQGSTIAD